MGRTTRIDHLIARAKGGDKGAFAQLYDAFVTRIYRFVYFRVGSREEAEDITEQIFVKIFTGIREYEERGLPFEAWLFRIARNMVTDYYRTKKASVSLEEAANIADTRLTPEEETDVHVQYEQVLSAVAKLPQSYQEIIILRFIEERETDEISLIVEKPAAHVRVLQSRALAKLKEVLGL